MEEAEFDKFADEYHAMHVASIGLSGEGPSFFAEYKIRDLAVEHAARNGPADPRILDFGAGSGSSVPFVARHFKRSRLTCLDVSKRSLRLAETRFGDLARYVHFDGGNVPFESASFDIVFAACVFHHIDGDEHVRLLAEWHRVLRPGGLALVYEHNPLNPLTRRVVNSCPFDENAQLIGSAQMSQAFAKAGFTQPQTRFRMWFPHALRGLRRFEPWLARIPLGAQYYVAATR